jgi:hypothetical protein
LHSETVGLPSGCAFFINLPEVDATILGKRKSNLTACLNAKQVADPLWNSHLTLGRDSDRHDEPQKTEPEVILP